MELEKIYQLIKNEKFDEKYQFSIFLDQDEQQIQFHNEQEYLVVWIKIDDDDHNLLRVYSDAFYSIVKITNIVKYLNYYFAIAFDDWTI